MAPHSTLTLTQARQLWSRNQRLGGDGTHTDIPGGWTRALGGVDPYLALKARVPTLQRAQIDTAMSAGDFWVVPGVRGCIWAVPTADVSLALVVADAQYRKRTVREMGKLGVSEEELATVGTAVLAVLEDGPLSPDELRATLPQGLVKSLGAPGKKVGHNTTLPAALRFLEGHGKLRRQQQACRLDTNRYTWGLPEQNLLTLGEAPDTDAGQAAALARRFFAWAGPAGVDEFVEWSTLGKRVARAAVAGLELVPVAIEGVDADLFVLPAQADGLQGAMDEDDVHLLPAQDNLITLRGSPALLANPAHHTRELMAMGGRTVVLQKARWVHQRPVFHRGEWIGLWDWDLDAQQVLVAGFAQLKGDVAARARAKAEALTPFIRDELDGRARANSIDGEKSQRRRAAAISAML